MFCVHAEGARAGHSIALRIPHLWHASALSLCLTNIRGLEAQQHTAPLRGSGRLRRLSQSARSATTVDERRSCGYFVDPHISLQCDRRTSLMRLEKQPQTATHAAAADASGARAQVCIDLTSCFFRDLDGSEPCVLCRQNLRRATAGATFTLHVTPLYDCDVYLEVHPCETK